MLKRLASSSKAKRPPRGSSASSSESDAKAEGRGRRRRKGDESDAQSAKASRLKKAGRMKRAPLLDYAVVEAVYSATAGQEHKSARRRLQTLFAKYDRDEVGYVSMAQFEKCLSKAGVKFDGDKDCKALATCFQKAGGGSDTDSSGDDEGSRLRVDYAAFVEFACNTRDSAQLSEVADQMRRAIAKYDRKRGGSKSSSSSFNLGKELKKLDKDKRGWIPSGKLEEFFDDLDDGPAFKLSGQQMAALVDRFEFEYDSEALGFDYLQFAAWVQPQQHLDTKQLHKRVKELIEQAHKLKGWKLEEVFDAIDDDRDGEIDALELKEALIEMGLPLTDTQIRALTNEYDVDGDGQIQYREFMSFFAPSTKKKGRNTRDADDASDSPSAKIKPRGKRNVRNTFSWGISKAFARKQAARRSPRPKRSKSNTRDQGNFSSSSGQTKAKKRLTSKKNAGVESTSDEDIKQPHKQRKKPTAKSSSSDTTSAKERKAKRTSKPATSDNQSEETVSDATPRQKPRRRLKSSATVTKNASSADKSESAPSDDNQARKIKKQSKKKRNDLGEDDEAVGDTNIQKRGATARARGGPERRSKSPTKANSRGRDRLQSTASQRSIRQRSPSRPPRSPLRRTQRFKSSGSTRQLHRRDSAQSLARQSTRKRRVKKTARNRSRKREPRYESSTSSQDMQGSGGDGNSDSASGLDVEQLRQMKRPSHRQKPATGHSHDSDDDQNDGTASDAEYFKHLKRALRRAFDFFDLDKSDAIEKRELDLVLRALGHDVTPKELEEELKRSDLDRNGRLDFYEFVEFVKRQLKCKAYLLTQKREMEIRQGFQALDADKNGVLDEKEFEYLVYKVLQVELSVEEQDALLDFVDTNGDGTINEEEFITFMKTMEEFYRQSGGTGPRAITRQNRFLSKLDGTSRLACSAMKKLVRGAPVDIDRNLLMFFDIPTNFRPAISSAATCRLLNVNTMAHALSFPSPQVVSTLAHNAQKIVDVRESILTKREDLVVERQILQEAEELEAQAIVSLKRAVGVPKPFDTREDDVVKRCVHVCLFQEREGVVEDAKTSQRFAKKTKTTGNGVVVGNIHEVPVYWHAGEEDVWEFSKKSTKEDKYKFLVRTNAINDRLFLLVEFIVHLRMSKNEQRHLKKGRARTKRSQNGTDPPDVREMVCSWCKIPLVDLVSKRSDPLRVRQKLWGGTAHAPVDIEQDEILRRRTGWRAVTNLFAKPSPPSMGIKSVAVSVIPEELQKCVPKLPPTIVAPFVSLPILAEYMTLMQNMLVANANSSSVLMCDPVLQLLPKIVDDHEALSIFRRVFDTEVGPLKTTEHRQKRFRELVLRMWPSFVEWRDRLPPSLLTSTAPGNNMSTRRLSLAGNPGSSSKRRLTLDSDNLTASEMRSGLLQVSAAGKLKLQDVNVPSAPFHVREVAFQRRL